MQENRGARAWPGTSILFARKKLTVPESYDTLKPVEKMGIWHVLRSTVSEYQYLSWHPRDFQEAKLKAVRRGGFEEKKKVRRQ